MSLPFPLLICVFARVEKRTFFSVLTVVGIVLESCYLSIRCCLDMRRTLKDSPENLKKMQLLSYISVCGSIEECRNASLEGVKNKEKHNHFKLQSS